MNVAEFRPQQLNKNTYYVELFKFARIFMTLIA